MVASASTVAFDLDALLDRVGLAAPVATTDAGLEALHRAHAYAVPFENLSILLGRGVDLAPQPLFEKLVRRRRGGYCFELNSLFLAALRASGFREVRPLLARVHIHDEPTGRTHMLNLVTLAGREWIADVGFGANGLRAPVPFEHDVPFAQDGLRFRLIEAPPFGHMLQVEQAGAWQSLYSFDLAPVLPADLALGNHFTATHPTSFFTWAKVVTRPAPWGRTTLFEHRLTMVRDGRTSEVEVPPGAEYLQALETHFGIRLDAPFEALRPLNPPPDGPGPAL